VLTGTVNAHNELVIGLPVQDGAGQAHHMEAILDTGFTGSLTLPSSLVARLDLRWQNSLTRKGNQERAIKDPHRFFWEQGSRKGNQRGGLSVLIKMMSNEIHCTKRLSEN